MNGTTNGPASPANGRRRSLNDTIARLDDMLDGLSEAIPATIRDELRVGVGAAVAAGVREALLEVLSSETFLRVLANRLAGHAPMSDEPGADPGPSVAPPRTAFARVKEAARRAAECGRKTLRRITGAMAEGVRRTWNWVTGLRRRLCSARSVRRPLLIALAVGGVVAVATLYAPEWLTAVLSGIGGAACAVVVQIGMWVRRTFSPAVAVP